GRIASACDARHRLGGCPSVHRARYNRSELSGLWASKLLGQKPFSNEVSSIGLHRANAHPGVSRQTPVAEEGASVPCFVGSVDPPHDLLPEREVGAPHDLKQP